MHVAISHGHLGTAKLLIEAHATNMSRHRSSSSGYPARPRASTLPPFIANTSTGHGVIHFAVALNNLEMLQLLVQNQKQLAISLDEQQCGYTPLHLAVHLKHTRAANVLLTSGASPNSVLSLKSSSTMTASPLAEATVNTDKDMVTLLVKAGAEDRRRDALNLCLRQDDPDSVALVPLLLSSLVKCDEVSTKQLAQSQSRKEGKQRLKLAMVDWANLDIDEMRSNWVKDSLGLCPFFKQQALEPPLCFDYVSSLSLCRNRLVGLPIELFHLKNLTSLNVSSNQLVALPDVLPTIQEDIGELLWPCPNLSRFNISSNKLTQLPEYLFELPNLTFLDASKNEIESLPFSVWCSPKLNNLNCSHNHIKAIPSNWPNVMSEYQIVNPMSPPGE